MRDYATSLGSDPPNNGDNPLGIGTMKKYIEDICRDLRLKFGHDEAFRAEPLYPLTEVRTFVERMKDRYKVNAMEGKEEHELIKSSFPLPRVHSLLGVQCEHHSE